jgi:uncharacterized protein YgiM (DUF1202 family)
MSKKTKSTAGDPTTTYAPAEGHEAVRTTGYAEAVEAAPVDTRAVSATTRLNVRIAPSLSSPVVRVLQQGEQIAAIGAQEGEWLPVDGGYVMARFVS